MADLIDRRSVYERACVGCTRHGNEPGECYHDAPCEKLIFAFTTATVVDAVEIDGTLEEKPQTNADRIRAMSDEELANWALQFVLDCSIASGIEDPEWEAGAEEEMIDWLKQPVKEEAE